MKRLLPVRTVAPVAKIVSLAEARAHLRNEGETVDDDLVNALISVAQDHIDGYTGRLGRALITQTWKEQFAWFRYEMPLRIGPVQSVSSVQYYDNENTLQTVSTSVYRLHERAGGAYLVEVANQSWPSTYSRDDAVTITYVAGYGDAATDVPGPIKQAALLLIGHYYENRAQVQTGTIAPQLPYAVDALLAPYAANRRFY